MGTIKKQDNRLISSTLYILFQSEKIKKTKSETQWHFFIHYEKMINYARFLTEKIRLGMFVPCWEVNDKPMVKPFGYDTYVSHREEAVKTFTTGEIERCEIYRQANEKVIFDLGDIEIKNNFEGWFEFTVKIEEYEETVTLMRDDIVEDLLTISLECGWQLKEDKAKQLYFYDYEREF